MAGYSGTPLAKKLGIKSGFKIFFVAAPENYIDLLAPLPDEVNILRRAAKELDLVHIFSTKRSHLVSGLKNNISRIKQNGMIWVSWPKKSSGVFSEITEDKVREIALPMGLVDVKVCAVDEVWSGLKLVIRKENRK